MKTTKLITILCLSIFSYSLTAQNLILFKSTQSKNTEKFAKQNNLKIHFHNSKIAIASGNTIDGAITLDETPWGLDENYFLIDITSADNEYINNIEAISNILFKEKDFMLVSVTEDNVKKLYPYSHGGLTNITNTEIRWTKTTKDKLKEVIFQQEIADLINSIEIDTVVAYDLHMQDYVTRDAYHPNSVQAQAWLQTMFESYGLPTFTHNFSMPGGEASDNVYAVQEGVVFPEKFIVIGGHYDSYSFDGDAPGADDNASGVAAIMELARILSNYEFNHSIIYCAFSGEEYGLYGSQALATDWANAGKDIIGYLNLDMIGYVHPGNDYFTGMCVYEESYPLADYFSELVETYVTDFYVDPTYYPIPNSDHTSFRNNGYMAIWPWEDVYNISPYIHTPNDTFGLSLNSIEYMLKFTESSMAFMADYAGIFNGYYPPMNLTLEHLESSVELTWQQPSNITDFSQYKVYRNETLVQTISDVSETNFTDVNVEIAGEYIYYIVAEYGGSTPGESMPSNIVSVIFGHKNYYSYDFEAGEQNWEIGASNDSWQWGISTPLSGNNTNYLSINSFDAGFGTTVQGYAISPIMDLSGYFNTTISMNYGFNKKSNEDFKLFIKPNPDLPWILLNDMQPSSSFETQSFELPVSMRTENCRLAFYYDDKGEFCYYAGVDDIEIKGFDNDASYEAPSNLILAENTGNIDLTWDIPTANGVEKYYIYRNNMLYDSVDNPAANAYTDNNVNLDNYYYYFVTALYEMRQSDPSNFATYGEPEGIMEPKNISSKIEIYPNPAKEFIFINSGAPINGNVSIFDLTGRKVRSEQMNGDKIKVDIHNLEQGTYFIVIESENKHISKKISKI